MKVDFTVLSHKYALKRYPAQAQKDNLQAWDAADEYLVEYIEQESLLKSDSKLAIVNDQFGALACCFHGYQPSWISDSFVAQKGMENNLKQNTINLSHITVMSDPNQLSDQLDIVIIKLPKVHDFLAHQLAALKPFLSESAIVIAAGKTQAVQKSVLSLFEKYIGPTRTSLAKKKSRLIFSTADSSIQNTPPKPQVWKLENSPFTLTNHANVFARNQLDIGARLMLAHLPNCEQKRVIDLGCGNGVLGLMTLANQQPKQVKFVDESAMAVLSAKQNVEQNLPDRLSHCQFEQSNCLEHLSKPEAEVVLCNPPFHQQNTISDHIAWQMFNDAYRVLTPKGELRVVANRHLGYHEKLKRIFGGAKVIASNNKFVILSSIKH